MLGASRSPVSDPFPLKRLLFIDEILVKPYSIGLGDHLVQEFNPEVSLRNIGDTTLGQKPSQ
jgi:hypothetical protein